MKVNLAVQNMRATNWGCNREESPITPKNLQMNLNSLKWNCDVGYANFSIHRKWELNALLLPISHKAKCTMVSSPLFTFVIIAFVFQLDNMQSHAALPGRPEVTTCRSEVTTSNPDSALRLMAPHWGVIWLMVLWYSMSRLEIERPMQTEICGKLHQGSSR